MDVNGDYSNLVEHIEVLRRNFILQGYCPESIPCCLVVPNSSLPLWEVAFCAGSSESRDSWVGRSG